MDGVEKGASEPIGEIGSYCSFGGLFQERQPKQYSIP